MFYHIFSNNVLSYFFKQCFVIFFQTMFYHIFSNNVLSYFFEQCFVIFFQTMFYHIFKQCFIIFLNHVLSYFSAIKYVKFNRNISLNNNLKILEDIYMYTLYVHCTYKAHGYNSVLYHDFLN